MRLQEPIALRTLIEEVERYLAAVDAFRRLGCEPTWRPEPMQAVTSLSCTD
jgi:hypothetical protein